VRLLRLQEHAGDPVISADAATADATPKVKRVMTDDAENRT
jgi:hypothetical protein